MRRRIPTFRIRAFAQGICAASTIVWGTLLPAKEVDFNRDIRPILSNKCFACHGPDSTARQAELRLDVEDSAKATRNGHAAIVAGRVDKSELVRRITTTEDDDRMPPSDSGKKLTVEEIGLLKQWIAEGAKWSLAWSYLPPAKHELPEVHDCSWPQNAIDNFVLARLEAEGIKPSADADKMTLVRRLYIDLIGLPPAPKEVDNFLLDTRANAYERLVDLLLASPHFGERMAMYWLDLVRYADTVGYHGDQEHHISPYRDYVIDALNANMPFDEFTREQLAGDLLPAPTVEQKIATGYNRVLQTSHEGGVQPKEYLAIYAADHVRNLSAVWMGATLGCAQCHDHKFDPFTTRDFYSMAAFFADIDEAQHLTHGVDTSPTVRLPELELLSPKEQSTLADLTGKKEVLQRRLKQSKLKSGEAASTALAEQLATCATKIGDIHKNSRRTMITVAIKPRITRILPRGNWMDESGEAVVPAIPAFLGRLDTASRRATRLDLANWLTDAQRGAGSLTARVMVNRFWYLLFGRGIAAKLDDFGGQGEPPDSPELLDYLALEFVNSGWDVKHMLKLIASSHAYKQSSLETPELREKDRLNTLIARQARFRYSAESVRDSALVISGLLVSRIGGPSVHPYQPANYYRHLNFPLREYIADTDDRQWRRGVYMHWQRQYLHPMLKAFDAPTREECTVQRARSNTSPAALVLLNDPTFVEVARAFAARILHEGGRKTKDRLNYAFRQALSRDADAEEHDVLEKQLTQNLTYYKEHRDAAEQLLKIGLTPAPPHVDKVDLASWTLVARVVLNLGEVITRN
jgi:hypothetical protein